MLGLHIKLLNKSFISSIFLHHLFSSDQIKPRKETKAITYVKMEAFNAMIMWQSTVTIRSLSQIDSSRLWCLLDNVSSSINLQLCCWFALRAQRALFLKLHVTATSISRCYWIIFVIALRHPLLTTSLPSRICYHSCEIVWMHQHSNGQHGIHTIPQNATWHQNSENVITV